MSWLQKIAENVKLPKFDKFKPVGSPEEAGTVVGKIGDKVVVQRPDGSLLGYFYNSRGPIKTPWSTVALPEDYDLNG